MMFATARGDVRIGYDVLGTGRPIVMLHDFGESSRFWCEHGCVKTCLTEGRQIVLIDLRSHGDSSQPASFSSPMRVRAVESSSNRPPVPNRSRSSA